MPVKGLASTGALARLGLSTEGVLVLSPWYKGLLANPSLFSHPALGLGPLGSELALLIVLVKAAAPTPAPTPAPAAVPAVTLSSKAGFVDIMLWLLLMLSDFKFCSSAPNDAAFAPVTA